MKAPGFSIFALAVCVAAASCGGGADTTTGVTNQPHNTNSQQVAVTNDQFTPSSVTIKAGGTVNWAWNTCTGGDVYGYGDQTCVSHQVGFDDGATSALQSTGSYSREFDAAGTYPYHCLVHGVTMSGTVIVQ